jgi:NitT/TauT family transport system substrate-binding protein/putative hydroxymethylpyrimidine transport system substrate-binding protein
MAGEASDYTDLKAIVQHDGGDYGKVKQVTIGFAAVSRLLSKRVDAVPAFWNAEGVILRRRGLPVREFRVDDYGAPHYPEVVLTTTRKELARRRGAIERALAAIAQGVRSELANPGLATKVIAAAAGNADPKLIRAQVRALAGAVLPPLRLDRRVLEQWSAFDARTGLLPHPLNIAQAFDFSLVR